MQSSCLKRSRASCRHRPHPQAKEAGTPARAQPLTVSPALPGCVSAPLLYHDGRAPSRTGHRAMALLTRLLTILSRLGARLASTRYTAAKAVNPIAIYHAVRDGRLCQAEAWDMMAGMVPVDEVPLELRYGVTL